MTTLTELRDKISEYQNPCKLGLEIYGLLTKELYVKHQKQYKILVSDFLSAASKNNRSLSARIICQWLEYSDFKDPDALRSLNQTNRYCSIWELYEISTNPHIKYKVLDLWCADRSYEPTKINDLFEMISKTKSTSSTNIEQLEDIHKLKLINSLIFKQDSCLLNKDLKIAVNKILLKINVTKVPLNDFLKIMSCHQYLNKTVLSKIAKLYPVGKFESLLSTAQALGIVNNPDYWIQSLPSTQKSIQNSIDEDTSMPIFD